MYFLPITKREREKEEEKNFYILYKFIFLVQAITLNWHLFSCVIQGNYLSFVDQFLKTRGVVDTYQQKYERMQRNNVLYREPAIEIRNARKLNSGVVEAH